MNNTFESLIKRNNNEIYIGVVGPVRSGKSTFIRNFMKNKIIPNIEDKYEVDKINDQLPLSGDGKEIMTVETKFIPNNVLSVKTQNLEFNFRLVDCVGYVIPEAVGHYTQNGPKLVKTPWLEEKIPFVDAATLGTKKVINNHSNIGIVITTDGTVTDFERVNYIPSEEEIIKQIKDIDKPYIIILNTRFPENDSTKNLVRELEEKYDNTVLPVDVEKMTEQDIDNILEKALYEYKIGNLTIEIPQYINSLYPDNQYKKLFTEAITTSTENVSKMKDVYGILEQLQSYPEFKDVSITNIDPSTGEICISIDANDDLYKEIVEDVLGTTVDDKAQFLDCIIKHKQAYDNYLPYASAIDRVNQTGYGFTFPTYNNLSLEEPEVIKQGSRYGVKLTAKGSSIHMIKIDVDSVFEPIIGSEDQSKQLIENIFNNEDIWSKEIFGRSLGDLVNDGVKSKLYNLSDYAQDKFRESLEKVVNTSKGGMVAILL